MVNTGQEMNLWRQFFCFSKNDPRASVIKSVSSQKHGIERKAHLGKELFTLILRHHFTCCVSLGVDTCWMAGFTKPSSLHHGSSSLSLRITFQNSHF